MSFALHARRIPVTDGRSSSPAVTLTLRYWAGSFDRREPAVFRLLAMGGSTVRRLTAQFITHDASATSPADDDPAMRHSPDYWLGMYCLAALVNIILVNLRAAFCT